MSNLHILTTSTSLFILATSKARVRYDMSNKLKSAESVPTRSMLCLIDKSSQFCNTKCEVAITCAFERRLRMSTMRAVPTCTANMHVRATLCKYRVLRY